ncbi:AMP-binding protein [Streptomyces daliensis]
MNASSRPPNPAASSSSSVSADDDASAPGGGTLGERLDLAVERFPEREALVDVAGGRSWTWAEFARYVELLALGLLGKAVAKGERVGVWAPNCGDCALIQFAVARVGAVLVSVDPSGGAAGLREALQRSGTEILFTVEAYEDHVEEVWDDCPELRDVFPFGDGWSEPMDLGLQIGDPRRVAEREAELSAEDPVAVPYGTAETEPLTHRDLVNGAHALVGKAEDAGAGAARGGPLAELPLSHPLGTALELLAAAEHGDRVVVPPPPSPPSPPPPAGPAPLADQ